jgi:hypothetical protein
MPRGGARPNSGRKRGSRNKRSIGLAERMAEARAALPASPVPPLPQDKRLARDVLEDFMLTFADMAAHYQPRMLGQRPNPHADEERFWKFSRFAVYCASALAPYQSPTFRAIVVAPPPESDKSETVKRFTFKVFDK